MIYLPRYYLILGELSKGRGRVGLQPAGGQGAGADQGGGDAGQGGRASAKHLHSGAGDTQVGGRQRLEVAPITIRIRKQIIFQN